MSFISAIANAVGWYDKTELNSCLTSTPIINYPGAARVSYYNGDVGGFKKYRDISFAPADEGGLNLSHTGDSGKELKKNDREIDLFARSSLDFSGNVENQHTIPMVRQSNGAGGYTYVRGAEQTTQRTEGVASVNTTLWEVPYGTLNLGGSVSSISYNGAMDVSFPFHPWMDRNTPDYLRRLNGTIYPLLKVSDIYTENAHLNYSLSMFALPVDMPGFTKIITPILINKVNIGLGYTHTGANLTTYNHYRYDETKGANGDMDDKHPDRDTFSSHRWDIPLSIDTRTFPIPIGPWYRHTFLSFSVARNLSFLNRNMPDVYYPLDDHFELPEYWHGVRYTTDDLNLMRSDHETYRQRRNNLRTLTANDWSFTGRYQLFSPVELFDAVGLTDDYNVGTDQPFKFAYTYRTGTDGISGTNNGLTPSTRDVFPSYSKVAGQPAQPTASSLNECITPETYNSHTFSFSYMPRVSNITKIKATPFDWGLPPLLAWTAEAASIGCAYFGAVAPMVKGKDMNWASVGALPAAFSLFRFTVGLTDSGDSGDEKYIPMEYSFGNRKTWVHDPATASCYGGSSFRGKSHGVGIGYKISDDYGLMYNYSRSDNGYNFRSGVHKVTLSIRFAPKKKSK